METDAVKIDKLDIERGWSALAIFIVGIESCNETIMSEILLDELITEGCLDDDIVRLFEDLVMCGRIEIEHVPLEESYS